jgi:cell division protein FtsL
VAEPELAPVERSGRTLRLTTVLMATLAMILLFGLVGFQALIVGNQSRIDDLEARIDDANRTNQVLRVRVGQLQAPERIRVIATVMLGMVEPEVVTYLEPIPASQLDPGIGE